jgi:hypothetical protein
VSVGADPRDCPKGELAVGERSLVLRRAGQMTLVEADARNCPSRVIRRRNELVCPTLVPWERRELSASKGLGPQGGVANDSATANEMK